MLDKKALARLGLATTFFALQMLLTGCGVFATPTLTVPPSTIAPTLAVNSEHLQTPTPPAGWTIHAKPDFQIALPQSWQEFPLDDAALKSAIDAASTNNPYLADTLRAILTTGQNKSFVFYAADKVNQTSSTVVDNISISHTNILNGTAIDRAVRQYADSLPHVLKGAKVIAFDAPLEINGQKAGEVDYDLPLVNGAGQVVTVRGVQFLIEAGSGAAYVVTLTGDAENADTFLPLAREIGRSFARVGP